MDDFVGNLRTSAMGILPHREVARALDLSLSLDIPFWPQLPKLNYYEDMYVQVSENFPGVRIDEVARRIDFDTARFYEELPAFIERMEDDDLYRVSPAYSAVYHEFLQARMRCGEKVENLSQERFVEKLKANREKLIAQTGCRDVRFNVVVKDGKASIKASPIK